MGNGDASCECSETGPYQSPAAAIAPDVEPDGSSAAASARYRVEATGTLPAVTLTVRRVSTNAVVMSTTTHLGFWGFSPDQDRFVITGQANGLHEVHLYNLTGPTPSAAELDIASTGRKLSVRVAGGKRAWFRIAATNAAGPGAWSKTVSAVAKRR